MFVLQKQLSMLNLPSSRVAKLYRSGSDIQLALPDLPSQMASAFLVLLKGAGKVQVLVGLHLSRSCCSIFYLSDVGEVAAEFADQELEAGLDFAESMGFVLEDIEFSRMAEEEQEAYWKGLPICRKQTRKTPPAMEPSTEKMDSTPGVKDKKKTPVSAVTAPIVEPAPERPPAAPVSTVTAGSEKSKQVVLDAAKKIDMLAKQQTLKERLGRFLASL